MIELTDIPGPWLELGGPTAKYLCMDPFPCKERLIVSNTHNGHGPIDMIVDATDIGAAGFEPDSIGAIFWSALPIDIRPKVWEQCLRFLRPGGVVLTQWSSDQDLTIALSLGFTSLGVQAEPKTRWNKHLDELRTTYHLMGVQKPMEVMPQK